MILVTQEMRNPSCSIGSVCGSNSGTASSTSGTGMSSGSGVTSSLVVAESKERVAILIAEVVLVVMSTVVLAVQRRVDQS